MGTIERYKKLYKELYSIKDSKLVYAEGLYIIENDSQEINQKLRRA